MNHVFIWLGGNYTGGFPINWGPISGASGTPANEGSVRA